MLPAFTTRQSVFPKGTGFNHGRKLTIDLNEVTLLKETFKRKEKHFIGYDPL